MDRKPKALIIGAGIAGVSAAWWLNKAGWTTLIIERAPTIRSGGYVMSLSGRCLEKIKAMGLYEDLKAISYDVDRNALHDNKSRELTSFNYEDVHGGTESRAVCRGDLAALLAGALHESATIQFNGTLDAVAEIEDGQKIWATLRSGDVIEADLLIGADGIRSPVRKMFWKDEDCLEDLGLCYATYGLEQKEPLRASYVSFNSLGHLDILYRLQDDRLAALHIWRDYGSALQDRALGFGLLRKVIPGSPRIAQVIDRAERSGPSPIIDSLTLVKLQRWSKGQGARMALILAEVLGKELMATEDITQALVNHEKRLRPPIERLQDRTSGSDYYNAAEQAHYNAVLQRKPPEQEATEVCLVTLTQIDFPDLNPTHKEPLTSEPNGYDTVTRLTPPPMFA
ncbi:uncharacterized protein B0J16DRAFT_387161 [Fusarium flagelliforme]|uniref:uncharacterized protein n=1 Tax=Fusarium flagelliforme TaxID=2675880 RepID=UPI001E8DFCB5|nr:uncharacterized protein B0J16DRAFT_387161 [Fusarium flagelliforme]KAH7179330.1 hypothetical protein B0J16DRAFT_387161 [Fusarium flagelliforme]